MFRTICILARRKGIFFDGDDFLPSPFCGNHRSAVSGVPFSAITSVILEEFALAHKLTCPFWATALQLERYFDAAPLPDAVGVDVGIGGGPVRVFHISDFVFTDAHFLLKEHPPPSLCIHNQTRQCIFDGVRWKRPKDKSIQSRLTRMIPKTTPGTHDPWLWVTVDAAVLRRMHLSEKAVSWDPYADQRIILYNAQNTEAFSEVTKRWASLPPHILHSQNNSDGQLDVTKLCENFLQKISPER